MGGNAAKRTRQEAETLLREAMGALRAEMKNVKKLKDATEVISKTTPKFTVLCRELSECETAKKGGMLCGELGWMAPEERGVYGAGFREVVDETRSSRRCSRPSRSHRRRWRSSRRTPPRRSSFSRPRRRARRRTPPRTRSKPPPLVTAFVMDVSSLACSYSCP